MVLDRFLEIVDINISKSYIFYVFKLNKVHKKKIS
jgi:hypothetical protein